MANEVPQVGAPDPELNTSPIFDEYDEASLDTELATGVCYFNGASYPIGSFVRSGEDVLRCVGGGVWVRWSEVEPE
jgi:hypothetical protein